MVYVYTFIVAICLREFLQVHDNNTPLCVCKASLLQANAVVHAVLMRNETKKALASRTKRRNEALGCVLRGCASRPSEVPRRAMRDVARVQTLLPGGSRRLPGGSSGNQAPGGSGGSEGGSLEPQVPKRQDSKISGTRGGGGGRPIP